MLFEYGDFDFLFFKGEDHTTILSFRFTVQHKHMEVAISLWQLWLPFSFVFMLSTLP